MATYSETTDIVNGHGHGGWGFGGGGLGVLIAVIVLWLLFRHDGHRVGFEGGHSGHVNGVRPSCYDESNYEQESKLVREQNEHDRRIIAENVKTRELIEKLDRETLRDKIAEQAATIAKQSSEAFTLALFNDLKGKIENLDCELPKRRPVWADTVTPCAGRIETGCGTPRRGSVCGDFAFA